MRSETEGLVPEGEEQAHECERSESASARGSDGVDWIGSVSDNPIYTWSELWRRTGGEKIAYASR